MLSGSSFDQILIKYKRMWEELSNMWELPKPSTKRIGNRVFLETSSKGHVQQLGFFGDGTLLDYGCQFRDGSQGL